MTLQKAQISVIVVTRNRPEKVVSCLESIIKNSEFDFEIILIDQSDKPITAAIQKFKKIRYFYQNKKGLSIGRNFAIGHSRGDILCFTDDDCIVDRNWIANIYDAFSKNKDICGIYGNAKPYRPNLNKGKICPCTFTTQKQNIITKPCIHYKSIGFGNNMSFKKEVFSKFGLFKEWLGVGSIGMSAEDAEFALRLLSNNEKILSINIVVVYHNNWLTPFELNRQMKLYIGGETCVYTYFALRGYIFARKIIADNFRSVFNTFLRSFKQIFLLKKCGIFLFKEAFVELFYIMKGLSLVCFFWSKRNDYLTGSLG